MAYQIILRKKALKFLTNVPKRDYLKLRQHISDLADDPHPPGSIKLFGSVNEYRYRYGDYRILYTIEYLKLIVDVFDIGNRKDVYR